MRAVELALHAPTCIVMSETWICKDSDTHSKDVFLCFYFSLGWLCAFVRPTLFCVLLLYNLLSHVGTNQVSTYNLKKCKNACTILFITKTDIQQYIVEENNHLIHKNCRANAFENNHLIHKNCRANAFICKWVPWITIGNHIGLIRLRYKGSIYVETDSLKSTSVRTWLLITRHWTEQYAIQIVHIPRHTTWARQWPYVSDSHNIIHEA